jgi:predicted metalloprotease with PDZ domain
VRNLLVGVIASVSLSLAAQSSQAPIVYTVSFPAPEHRFAQVEVTFPGVPAGPLQARMSRSSPGRYAVHEFAKNVYDVHVFDGRDRELTPTRPTPYEWDVAGHDGTVRIRYKVYGDTVDGTYLAIDTTHAHLNMPATLMWARHMEDRPVRVTFVPPARLNWKPATQLYTTTDPWTFTAPNLQYMMDSPTELSDYALREFRVSNPDGKTFTIRTAVHTDATPRDIDQYAAAVQKIVNEEEAVYGEFPQYEPGTYTFLADYLPWDGGDGMEHRNSTSVSGRSLAHAASTAAHEFFHCWNVERIRPQGLEPFNFEDANLTDSLWLAEGFTQYYGELILARTGLVDPQQATASFGYAVNWVVNGSGRQFRSAVEMSRMAPFVDAARSVDRTNFETTFISYYTYGAAIALGLDFSLRERSNGKVTLDDFMRAMWKTYGKPGGPEPGLVAHPYSLDDIRDRLADVSGDRSFADDFMRRYVEGREAMDYARLVQAAGVEVRRSHPGQPWIGNLRFQSSSAKIGDLVAPGTPAYDAGLEQDDEITSMEGKPIATAQQIADVLRGHKPGDRIEVTFKRRSGPATGTIALKEDPSFEFAVSPSPTAEQRAFRKAWLGSRQ